MLLGDGGVAWRAASVRLGRSCGDTVRLVGHPAEAAASFRAEVRDWLDRHVGPYRVDLTADSASLVFADVSDSAYVDRGKAWQRLLHDAGWAGLGWPVEHGGRGASMAERVIWAQESAAAGAPPGINLLAEGIVGPTLMAHGDEQQQRRYLPPMLTGEEIWCQLFSEPDAGSDIAAVRTTAVRDGDGWRVDGHKTWTSAAHYADFGVLLARTDWDAPKHRGSTYFVVDLHAPGVTTRPLRQMTGGAAFNEVLLDGVPVPDPARVGDVGEGWSVARTTLWHERLNLGLGLTRVGGGVGRVLDRFAASPMASDPVVRQTAAQLWIESRCLGYLGERALAALAEGGAPGPEGSVAKLASARVSRRCDELLDASRGAGATVWDDDTLVQLWIPATSIAGGTDEVLRSVLAERVLGLPRSWPSDGDVPFRDVAH